MTVVPAGPLSYLTLWPTGQTQPFVSTLNSFGGIVVANAAIVPAGADGAVSVYVTDPTDVILDINGYFDASGERDVVFVLSRHAVPRGRHARRRRASSAGRPCRRPDPRLPDSAERLRDSGHGERRTR